MFVFVSVSRCLLFRCSVGPGLSANYGMFVLFVFSARGPETNWKRRNVCMYFIYGGLLVFFFTPAARLQSVKIIDHWPSLVDFFSSHIRTESLGFSGHT